MLPAISFIFLFLSQCRTLIPQINAQTTPSGRENAFVLELREANLKIDRLESILEESILDLNSKSLYLRENEKLIKEMTHQIDLLQSTLLSLKDNSSRTNERINELEKEVQLLWAASRKNNFELHNLELKANEAEKKLDEATSRVEKMADIVNEQWIQVQQLEQALQIAETRAMTAKREASCTKCSFVKFIRNHFGSHLQSWQKLVDIIMSAGRHYHHRLQAYVRREMKKSGYHHSTVINEEVVFVVASALVVFPLLGLGMFLLTVLGK